MDVRAFVGGAFRKADEFRRKYADRFGLLTPLLLAFWTTGDFSLPAKTLAKELGLWYLNGVGLAQFATRLGLEAADLVRAEQEAVQIAGQRRATSSGGISLNQ